MKFRIIHTRVDDQLSRFAREISGKFEQNGYRQAPDGVPVKFILNLTSMESARAGIRKSQAEYVVSLVQLDAGLDDPRSACYTTLVKTLSNILLCIDPETGGGPPEVYVTTPEAGYYHFPYDPQKVYECLLPVITSHLMINNRLTEDLPVSFLGNERVNSRLREAGQALHSLGVLPAPFPLHKVLDQKSLDHLYRLFRMRGLSFGNFSMLNTLPFASEHAFWMTARGVDKAHLKGIGEDVLLVTGYREQDREILVSVPPGHDPRARVSVDAIEHVLIYREFPEVGAIVHVHAWMDGVASTRQNYPCGSIELGRQVVELLRQAPDPSRCAVGLINHGLTITGPSMEEIFNRIQNKLVKTVPMSDALCTP